MQMADEEIRMRYRDGTLEPESEEVREIRARIEREMKSDRRIGGMIWEP